MLIAREHQKGFQKPVRQICDLSPRRNHFPYFAANKSIPTIYSGVLSCFHCAHYHLGVNSSPVAVLRSPVGLRRSGDRFFCIKDLFWRHVLLFVPFLRWLTGFPTGAVTDDMSDTMKSSVMTPNREIPPNSPCIVT